jgi:flagellar basal body-associated protein FliL
MRFTPIKALAAIAALLAVCILAGTVFAFATGLPGRKPQDQPSRGLEKGEGYFQGIGAIRARTRDSDTKIVAVSVSCLYDASDLQFSEELRTKAPELRKAAEAFFSGKLGADLSPAFEGRVKAELRDRLNALLILGKVKEVYFSDFAVIE